MGYEINAYNFLRSHEVRRIKFLKDQNISLVLDVGANEGQYGAILRQGGFNGKIISFEPVQSVFQKLIQCSNSDPKWIVRNEALGDFDGYTQINISDFSQVSSILSATGLAGTNYWKGNIQEKIGVRQLDSLIEELQIEHERVLLKIDTQGFEENVLRGCQKLLQTDVILFLEVELSIRQFYSEEKLFPEMFSYIRSLGFELVSMCPVHIDATRGYVLQYDCTFIRSTILDAQNTDAVMRSLL
jgi:FkbM family methyltransferase